MTNEQINIELVESLQSQIKSLQSQYSSLNNQFQEFKESSFQKIYQYETSFQFINNAFLDFKNKLMNFEQNFTSLEGHEKNIQLLLRFREQHQQDTFLLKHEFNQLFEVIEKLKDINAALRISSQVDVEEAAKRILNKIYSENNNERYERHNKYYLPYQ